MERLELANILRKQQGSRSAGS